MDNKIIEFGGDSITILHLVGDLQSNLQWDVVPSDIVEYTPSQLISKYQQHKAPALSTESKVTVANTNQKAERISGSQEALLSMDHIALGPTYNIPYTFLISGENISCTRLTYALGRVLMVIASTVYGKSYQAFNEVVHVDLSALPIDKSQRHAIYLSQKNALLPFDLKKAPFRCILYYVGEGCYVLSLVIHHISFDYSSWSTIQRILEDSYKLSSEEGLETFTCNKSYSNMDEHLNFWKEEMKGCSVTFTLPTTFEEKGARPFVGKRLEFKLDGSLIGKLCHGIKIDPSVLFLAVYGLLVHKISKQSLFGIGVNISQRHTTDLKQQVGFLTNTVICKFPTDVLEGHYFDLLLYVQNWQKQAVYHSSVSILEVIKFTQQQICGPKYLPELLFNFISRYTEPSLSLGEYIVSEYVELPTRTSKAKLVLDVNHDGECYNIVWEYCTSLFSDAYIMDWNQCFSSLLDHVLSGVYKSLRSFEMDIPQTICPLNCPDLALNTTTTDVPTHKEGVFRLNYYQNKLLHETLQSIDHLHGGLHASVLIPLDDSVGVRAADCTLHSLLSNSTVLASSVQIKDDTGYLVERSDRRFHVTYEVVSKKDELAVKLREHLWPFDIFAGPLLRFTLVHNIGLSKKYLLVTTHQLLMNEHSLILLCNQMKSILNQKVEVSACALGPHPYDIQQDDKEGMDSWIQSMSKYGKPSPVTLEYNYSSPCVVSETLSEKLTFSFANHDDLMIQSCVLTSIFLWNLQKSSIIQFCVLKNLDEGQVQFCASENIYSLSIEIDLSKPKYFKELYDIVEDYLKHTSQNSSLPCYWALQEQISPFSSYANPYHDVLLQVSDSTLSDSVEEEDLVFPRPFKIHVLINARKQRMLLKTSLNAQQTIAVQKCFTESVATFSKANLVSSKVTDHQISSSKLPSHPLSSLSKTCGSETEPLSSLIEKELISHPYSVVYTDISRGESDFCANVPCIVTAQEFHNQVKLVSCRLHDVIKDKVSAKVAIVTEGGYEMSISMVAAIQCKCTFIIIQSVEEHILLERLNQVKVCAVLYDRFRISTVEIIVRSMPFLDFVFVTTFNEQIVQRSNTALAVKRHVCSNFCAYVVVTSGSTGMPKVIQVSEKSLYNLLSWHTEKFSPSGNMYVNWLQFAHPHFDAVVLEILGQLLLNNNTVLITPANRLNSSYVMTALKRYHINCLHTTPTILSQFLREKNLQNITWNYKAFPELQHVFSGGERVSFDHYSTFLQRFQPKISFHNWGGPAEACIAYAHCDFNDLPCLSSLPMGTVITNTLVNVFSLSTHLPLPRGMTGEIAVSGLPICKEFLKAHELYKDSDNRWWYLSGDIGYINTQNQVVLLCRKDKQIKLNSERMNIDGIREMILKLRLSNVVDVIVNVIATGSKNELVCFPIVTSESVKEISLQEQLMSMLPRNFLPRVVKCFLVHQVPKLATGKINYQKLQEISRTPTDISHIHSAKSISKLMKTLLECIVIVLPHTAQLEDTLLLQMSLDNLGMNSLHKAQFHQLILERNLDVNMSTILLSRNLHDLAQKISGNSKSSPPLPSRYSVSDSERVVIIATEINVPGAKSCDELWNIIDSNKETITHNLPNLINSSDPQRYVGSRGLINGVEYFDAQLFNIHDEEARYLDPQQRLLLQAVWTCMEKAGYDPVKFSKYGKIGCFAATHFPQYLINCISSLPQSRANDVVWGNLRDNVALRVGRCLDFRGPCITFANNCASLAVALHHARVSLLRKECDIAVVAAATIFGKRTGYIYKEMDIFSPDGHCHPFSVAANGTVMSDGLTVLVLRRLSDARINNDNILCVVANTAVGSDGALASAKSYAPAVHGQLETLMKALENIPTSTIKLIEAHGTGTRVGDEIEIESLRLAFKDVKDSVILGSVKGNIGHIGVASAGPGIIKAALALKKRKLPPSIIHDQPTVGLQKSIFCCLDVTREWEHDNSSLIPRRALVQSVGVLGVNAVIVLEEDNIETAPFRKKERRLPEYVPLCMSAKTEWSLKSLYTHISEFAVKNPDISLVDLAYSLSYGRMAQPIRLAKVLTETKQLSESLRPDEISSNTSSINQICVAFSGQGTIVSIPAFRAYSESIPEFKTSVSKYCTILEKAYPQHFAAGMTELLTTHNTHNQDIKINLLQPVYQHLLTVIFQLGVYTVLHQLGVDASIVMGHSLGEYTAACVAGYLSVEELLHLTYKRAILLEEAAPGGLMLAVSLSGEECQSRYLSNFPYLEVSCFNSPEHCVVSGPIDDIHNLHSILQNNRVHSKVLETMHIAYHHSDLKQVAVPKMTIRRLSSKQMISTLKGFGQSILPINSELDSDYWKTHLVTPIDFPEALSTLMKYEPNQVRVIEIGMAECLKIFASKMNQCKSWCTLVSSDSPKQVISFLAEIWKAGIPIELFRLPLFDGAKKCLLPTYVFDVKRFWIEDVRTPKVNNSLETVCVSVNLESKPVEVLHTKDSILALIKKITGPGYETQLPLDSLNLVHLRDKIMDACNVDITDLLKKEIPPDPEALAQHIASHTRKCVPLECEHDITDYGNPIIELSVPQSSKFDKPYVFIVHAIGGEMFSFQPLAALLSQSYQVYGVHSSHALRHLSTVQDIAAFYCSKIKQIQSHGPFIIGGYSYGAWIAHSIAKLLEENGQSVSLLFMIEPLKLENLKPTSAEYAFERAIVLSDVYVKSFLKNPNKELMEDMIKIFKKQVDKLIGYRNLLQQVNCETKVLLARERLKIDGQHLKQSSQWAVISSGDVQVIEIPGSHSNCISSLNCFHIAKNIPLKNIDLTRSIPPSSTAEIAGSWRLDSISNAESTILSSQQRKQTKLFLSGDEDYFCMVPESVLVSCYTYCNVVPFQFVYSFYILLAFVYCAARTCRSRHSLVLELIR